MTTSRSDVSKMLVAHHSSRASSVVSSSSLQRRRTSRLPSRGTQREHIAPVSSVSVASGASVNDEVDNLGVSPSRKTIAAYHHGPQAASSAALLAGRPLAVTQGSGRRNLLAPFSGASGHVAAGNASVASAGGKSYGFLQMKCLEVLKGSSTPLHIQEIQVALGPDYPVAADREFLSRFRTNPRVNFDSVTKKWSFFSPYQSITSPEAILYYLQTKEFEINSEVLEYRKEITQWVNRLLSERRCRAVRGTKVASCKVFSSGSGLFCDLYNPSARCDPCQSLQGVILYQLGSDYLENVVLDSDVKELWHKIPPFTVADLESYYGVDRKAIKATTSGPDSRTKRRKPAGGRAPRVQKIVNLHMYTTEEFKEALAMDAEANQNTVLGQH